MTNITPELTYDFLEFDKLKNAISLEIEHIDQALQLSHAFRHPSRTWQIYLNAMALFGFEEWLVKRAPDLPISQDSCSLWQHPYANVLDVVCNLKVGQFKVCLIPTICFTDEDVPVPRAVIDLPEFTAHFYVIIGIEDELEIAAIRGFMRYDQLVEWKSELKPDIDWNYPLPLAWFNQESDKLLLYLQCLEPTAIPLPEISNVRQATLSKMQTELATVLPQLQNRPLWQVLTWEQGTAVLTSPDLLNWIYQSGSEITQRQTHYLSDLLQLLTGQAVNVSWWLRNQMDEMVQELSWEVLAAPSPIRKGARSRAEELAETLDDILVEIIGSSYREIPSLAQAYQDINLAGRWLRLYAVTWTLPDTDEWTLLLILGAVPGDLPPYEFKLRVSDQTGILLEEELNSDSHDAYIFTQVEGTYEETFVATIMSADREAQVSRLFEFSWN
jgi:hypothetical protein